jgi:hypothetical protein
MPSHVPVYSHPSLRACLRFPLGNFLTSIVASALSTRLSARKEFLHAT